MVDEVNDAGFPGQMLDPNTPVGGGANTVKLVKLVPVAEELDTTIGPDTADAGKVACMVVLFTTLYTAATPPIVTLVMFTKLVPVRVIAVPVWQLLVAGVKEVIVGTVSQVIVAAHPGRVIIKSEENTKVNDPSTAEEKMVPGELVP